MASRQALHGLGGTRDFQAQFHAGRVLGQPLQQFGQKQGADAGRGAYAHVGAKALGTLAHLAQQGFAVGQQAASAFGQQSACGRQLRLALAAHQQRCVQARFQLLDVQADGGRRQVKGLGGGSQRAQVGHGHQGLELVKVQASHQVS